MSAAARDGSSTSISSGHYAIVTDGIGGGRASWCRSLSAAVPGAGAPTVRRMSVPVATGGDDRMRATASSPDAWARDARVLIHLGAHHDGQPRCRFGRAIFAAGE